MKNYTKYLLLILSFLALPSLINAKSANSISDDATEIIKNIFGTSEQSIPTWLLDKAKAVLVIPDFKKGDKPNQGIFSVRISNGTWSLPSFANIKITNPTDNKDINSIVLIFMKGNGNDELRKGNVIVSGAGVVSGPKGNINKSDFDHPDHDVVYAYSVNDNKAAPLSIELAVITTDFGLNKDMYSKDVATEQIINNQDIGTPPEKAVMFQTILNVQSIGR